MSPKRKAFITVAVAAFSLPTGVIGTKAYQFWRDDIQDLRKYRGYFGRYYASLFRQIQKNKGDNETRIRLADGLYSCGVYNLSGDLYDEAYRLSGENDPSLKSKRDKCRMMYLLMRGNRVNTDMLDMEEFSRGCPGVDFNDRPAWERTPWRFRV